MLLFIATALWLGILTSISPCPLASNIAAVSYTSLRLNRRFQALLYALVYTLGRSITYVAISFLIIKTLITIPTISQFLQLYINKILGLLLVVTGMLLLDLIKLKLPRLSPSEKMQVKFDRLGIIGSFFMGILFALAFCPVSAALYFGSLIPLALQSNSRIVMPLLYGIGTSFPVLFFSLVVAIWSQYASNIYQKVTRIEFYLRRITGVIFILVGAYYILAYVFEIF
jgi:cytochrome c-type biogenesis protein